MRRHAEAAAGARVSESVVRLRGHHLLCVLNWAGAGYTRAFTARFDALVEAIHAGAPVEIVEGPDPLCQVLIEEDACEHCHGLAVLARDRRALEVVGAILARALAPGDRLRLDPPTVARLRAAYAAGRAEAACAGCEWTSFCRAIADGGFTDARLEGRPVTPPDAVPASPARRAS